MSTSGRNVALEGGPLDGWWFRLQDWEATRSAAIHMNRTKHMPQGQVLGYEPTNRTVAHKRMDATADVWKWSE